MFPQQMADYSLHFILLCLCFWLDPDSALRLQGKGESDDSLQLQSWLHHVGHASFNEAFAKRLDQCIMALTNLRCWI